MTTLYWIVAVVAVQRLVELIHARRNMAHLLARGGVEWGKGHYPLIVALHATWLITVAVAIPADTPLVWPVVALYGVVQIARYWTIATLGSFWTTRVIVIPGEAPVRRGPYRFIRHPNYTVLVCEIALLPLAFGAWEIAGVFSVLNAALLAHRIRIEDAALGRR